MPDERDPTATSDASEPRARGRSRSTARPERRTGGGHRPTIAVVLAVGLFALLVRLPGMTQEPNVDELLNVLAARAWAERGELSIVEGANPYGRGDLVTRLQAGAQSLGDDDLVASRGVSLAFGIAVVVGAAAWAGLAGGALAAGIAGALVAIDPLIVQLHQSARFYAALQLLFLLGAGLGAAALTAARPRRRALLGAAALLALYLAVRTHVVSLIGAAFLVGFAVLWHLPGLWSWYRGRTRGARVGLAVAVAAVAAGALAVAFASGLVDWAIRRATYVDAWAQDDADNIRFYYVFLYDQFSALVVLLPLLAVFAVRRHRLHGSLTFFVFLAGFVVASLMAWKSERYIGHLLPVLYVGVGLGGASLWAVLREHVPDLARQAFGTRARWVGALALAAVVAAPILANRALLMTARLVTRDPAFHFPLMPERARPTAWRLAVRTLEPWIERAEVIASERPPKALYYIGRLDYSLQYNAIERLAPDEAVEGTTHDGRFNRPVTRDPEVLRAAACEGDVLVVNDQVPQEGASDDSPALPTFLEEETQKIELDPRFGMNAYWIPERSDCTIDGPGAS